MGRIQSSSLFRSLGLTIPQVCTVFTYGFRLYFIVAVATVAGSIALQFMKDPGQRKTLLNALIGLNLVAITPFVAMIVLSTASYKCTPPTMGRGRTFIRSTSVKIRILTVQ